LAGNFDIREGKRDSSFLRKEKEERKRWKVPNLHLIGFLEEREEKKPVYTAAPIGQQKEREKRERRERVVTHLHRPGRKEGKGKKEKLPPITLIISNSR